MIKKIALKKLLVATISIFIIISISTIPTIKYNNKNILRTNLDIEDITNISTNKIFLLNDNNYLVQTDIFIDTNNKEEQIEKIIEYLTINNDKIPLGLKGYIPQNTKILSKNIDNKTLYLDFSKEFLSNNTDTTITGLVYSLLGIDNINNIYITVNKAKIPGYDKLLNKSIGINNKYLFNSRKDINKVVIYYMENINDNTYYVPITKYLNDKREKIEIIVDELSKATLDDNLISTMNDNTVLLDYKEESNVLLLNFNDYLLENYPKNEDLLQTIAYSVFANYDVNMVMFEVNNKEYNYIKRS